MVLRTKAMLEDIMSKNSDSPRDRIRNAAKELLLENNDIESITVRQIANRANVGVGLVNYHYSSKDALLAEVVSEKMNEMIRYDIDNTNGLSPKEKLQTILIQLFDLGAEYLPLLQFLIRKGIEDGNMDTALELIPFLRAAFDSDTDEMKLRVLALQILYPLQMTCISPEKFKQYSGIDVSKAEERKKYVTQLIDNII